MSELSKKVKEAIKKSGLSLRELEAKSGVPHSAIQRYATGATSTIPIERLQAIAHATGTTVQKLLGWDSPDTFEKKNNKMEPFGETIKELRTKRGMSQQELADKLGTSKQVISRYENNQCIPKISFADEIANALGVSLLQIVNPNTMILDENCYCNLTSNIFPVKLKKFPLLDKIACGKPSCADEQHGEYIEASVDIKADFCLRAKGDSMIEAQINDGDVVFVHEQPIVENGEIAAVIIDDEATLKRWYYDKDKNKLTLVAANAKYSPLVYIGEELNSIRCLGKAVSFMKYL